MPASGTCAQCESLFSLTTHSIKLVPLSVTVYIRGFMHPSVELLASFNYSELSNSTVSWLLTPRCLTIQYLELPRFFGLFIIHLRRVCNVKAQAPQTIRAGVSAANGRAGTSRTETGGAEQGIWLLGLVDSRLGQTR